MKLLIQRILPATAAVFLCVLCPSAASAGTIFRDGATAVAPLTIYVNHNFASGVVSTVPAGSALTLETGPYGKPADWWYGKDNASGAVGWFQAAGFVRTAVTIPDGVRWIHVNLDDVAKTYQARLMVGLTVVDTMNIAAGMGLTDTPEGTYNTLYRIEPLYELAGHPGVYLRWWQTWRDDPGPGDTGAWGLHTWVLNSEGFPKLDAWRQYGRLSGGCLRFPRAQDNFNFLPLGATVHVEWGPYLGPTVNGSFQLMVKRTLTDVNIRSGPGSANPIVGRAQGGQAFVADQMSMGWYHVTVNGVTGWIWGGLLLKLPEPVVQANPSSIAFTMVEKRAAAGVTPAPQTVALSEPNGKTLYSAAGIPDKAWLTSGIGAALRIYINDGANALPAGVHSAVVKAIATDAVPASINVTLTVLRDTDGDGTADVVDGDDDNDGLWDNEEAAHGTSTLNGDSDGDGTSDLAEVLWGSNPLSATQKAGAPLPALFQVKVNTTYLNVREGPGTRFALLGRATMGQIYTVYKQDGVFYRITFGGKAGWVHMSYVVKYTPPPPAAIAVKIKAGMVNVNVRSTNSTSGAIFGTVQAGQIYVSDLSSGGWFRIRFDQRYGWVRGDMAAKVAATTVRVSQTEVNVRTGAGTAYSILSKVYTNYRYAVAGSVTGWTKVWFRGRTAWIYNGGIVRVAL